MLGQSYMDTLIQTSLLVLMGISTFLRSPAKNLSFFAGYLRLAMNVYYFRNKNHIRLVEHLGTCRNKYQLVPIYHFQNQCALFIWYLDGQKIIIKPDEHFMLVGDLEHVLCFHSVGNFIIPTDFHMFQRGRYTTNQYVICGILTFSLGDHVFFPIFKWNNGEFGDPSWSPCHGYSIGFGNLVSQAPSS